MSNAFIRLADRGKHHGWRFLFGGLVTLGCFFAGSQLLFSLLSAYVLGDGNPLTRIQTLEAVKQGQPLVVGVPHTLVFAVFVSTFFFFLGGLWVALRWLHRRALVSLVTPAAHISWSRVAQGFGIYFGCKVLEITAGYALSPESYRWTFQPMAMLVFLPLILLLIPMQAMTEELFFRGYLLQAVGRRFGVVAAIAFTSIFFCVMHLSNPEVVVQQNWQGVVLLAAYYGVIGVFLAWVTVRDRSLELAMGIHTANNIATLLLVTSSASAVPSPALLTVRSTEMSPSGLLIPIAGLVLCGWLIFYCLPKRSRVY